MSLTTNLLAYWKLDANGSAVTLTDSSGNGNTLTNNGGVALGTGKINGCSVFDGSNNLSGFTLSPTNNLSYSAWFKSASVGQEGAWFGIGTEYTQVARLLTIGGDVYYQVPDATTANTTGGSYNDGNWHHAVGTSDGTTIKLYIDGSLIASVSNSSIVGTSGTFHVGNGGDFNANCSIDEVGVWSRALSVAEVTELYNGGAGLSHPFSVTTPTPHRNLVPRATGLGKLGTDALRWAEGHFQTSLSVGGSQVALASHAHPAADVTGLSAVATSGSYADLLSKPTLFSGSAADLTGTLADARLSSNVSLDNQNNAFTVGQSITAPANTSALTASYSVTGANTTPLQDLSGTWNTTGVARGILLNVTDTASAAASQLLTLQTAGTTRFQVRKDGIVYASNMFTSQQYRVAASLDGSSSSTIILNTGLGLNNSGSVNWASTANGSSGVDVLLVRDAANTLALRNGGTAGTPVPQNFRLYNYTDSGLANFERGFMRWNSNVLEIGTEAGGTGTARNVFLRVGAQTIGVTFSAAGSGVDINSRSFSTTAGMAITGTVISGWAQTNYLSGAADPTTTTITSGNWQVHRNTTSGQVRLWANNNGTLVSVALA